MSEYPSWICSDCGHKYGRVIPGHVATYHMGDKCGWCGREVATTEPRDFRHPQWSAKIAAKAVKSVNERDNG